VHGRPFIDQIHRQAFSGFPKEDRDDDDCFYYSENDGSLTWCRQKYGHQTICSSMAHETGVDCGVSTEITNKRSKPR